MAAGPVWECAFCLTSLHPTVVANHVADHYSTTELTQQRAAHQADQPFVYIVLLNWNGWQDTLECMRSLYRMEYQNWHIVVVDNGSSNDSVERLKEIFPEVSIMETKKNLGFAAGNNVGIRDALANKADYVFVLNNDTTVSPNTISQFVEFAEKHPEAALMGPSIDRRNPQREWPIRRKMNLLTVLCAFTALRRIITRIPMI